MKNKRIESFDILRGISLMFIILLHSAIYNYANIHQIDFSNPPIIIVLMSFMALWGGIFIVLSTLVNALMFSRRTKDKKNFKIFSHLSIIGVSYLFLHYILNMFLGRWNVDFVNNTPDMTFIANILRNVQSLFPPITKLFEGSSLSTIGLNLIILSGILFFFYKKKIIKKYLYLGVIGSSIMLLSFVRIFLYGYLTQAIESHNYLLSTFYSFTLANPYPLLPYLAYGFFGALIGLMIFDNKRKSLKRIVAPIGSFFMLYGLSGMMSFEKTISTPDWFWYFKTNFELGAFILLLIFTFFFLENKTKLIGKLSFIKRFSRVSLSVYMLETFLSEIVRLVLNAFYPMWNQTINNCLLFGGLNILIWIIILFYWEKVNFKYSLEYFWVKFFGRLGKKSTKMKYLGSNAGKEETVEE